MGGTVATAGQFAKWFFGVYSMYPASAGPGRGWDGVGTLRPSFPRAGRAGPRSETVWEAKAGSREDLPEATPVSPEAR